MAVWCEKAAEAQRIAEAGKEECLHRVVPLGEGHLRLLVREYVEHYHHERNHQGLDNQLLQRPPPPISPAADVARRDGSADCSISTIERPRDWSAHESHHTTIGQIAGHPAYIEDRGLGQGTRRAAPGPRADGRERTTMTPVTDVAYPRRPARPVHDPLPTRPGRDGRCSPGPGPASGPSGGDQGPAARPDPRRHRETTLPPGGEGRISPRPPEHLHHPRDQRDRRRPAVPRHYPGLVGAGTAGPPGRPGRRVLFRQQPAELRRQRGRLPLPDDQATQSAKSIRPPDEESRPPLGRERSRCHSWSSKV